MNKVYIVVKTQSNFYGSELVGIDCVFKSKKEAQIYVNKKNKFARYIRYEIKMKNVKNDDTQN